MEELDRGISDIVRYAVKEFIENLIKEKYMHFRRKMAP